jgi:hypothetical protein
VKTSVGRYAGQPRPQISRFISVVQSPVLIESEPRFGFSFRRVASGEPVSASLESAMEANFGKKEADDTGPVIFRIDPQARRGTSNQRRPRLNSNHG